MNELEKDLDSVVCSGSGRRVLAWIIKEGLIESPLADTEAKTAFNLGLLAASRSLERRVRDVNYRAWLLMMQEIHEDPDHEPTDTRTSD